MANEIDRWAYKLLGEAESKAADCCFDEMSDDDIPATQQEMCAIRNAPDELSARVLVKRLCAKSMAVDSMDADEKRDSIHDMLLELCAMRHVPDEMIGSVSARLLQLICGN